MGRDWKNPQYDYDRRQRRRALAALAVFALVVIAVLAPRLLRRSPVPGVAAQPLRSASMPRPVPRERGTAEPADDFFTASPTADEPGPTMPAPLPGGSGGSDDFVACKAQAISLYRRNKLTEALERVQAALALRRDAELLELQGQLTREIEVQRDYDVARTAHFVVLFDGYEHEEMKRTVLDILKDAYATIGKELDYFPSEPVTVILYTGKDFSDITRAPQWSGGMFGKADGKIRLPVQGAAGRERELRRGLFHEYVHALLHSLAPATPMWLHEGLAQFLSGDEAVQVAQVIPLGLLDNGFPRQARLAYVAYMESLQAVQDLVDEHGMSRLRRLLDGLGAGKGIEAAFAAAYGEPFSRWAAGWRPTDGQDAEATAGDAGEEDG
jgi:hypothetical protein